MEQASSNFYNLIEQHYTSTNDDKGEKATELLEYTSRIEYLPFLQQFLGKCMNSNTHLFVTFNCMVKIVELRGCLMQNDMLMDHFMKLKAFVCANANRMIQVPAVINSASRAIATAIRFIIEQGHTNPSLVFGEVQQLFVSDSPINIVALHVMTAIVNAFSLDTNLPHLSTLESKNLRNTFKNSFMHDFIKAIYPLIFLCDSATLTPTLELLVHCFRFCDDQRDASTVNVISYPREFSPYFLSQDALTRISSLCFNPEFTHNAYQVLFYMASASNVWDSNILIRRDFFSFLAQQLMSHLLTPPDDSMHHICQILRILTKQLDEHFIQTENSRPFLEAVATFSVTIFSGGESTSVQNMIAFWANIATWRQLPQNVAIAITGVLFQVVTGYIEVTLTSIQNDRETWLQILENDVIMNRPACTIWSIAENCHNQVYELVINNICCRLEIENLGENLLALTFLVSLVSSRLGRDQDQSDENLMKMYICVLQLIGRTTPILKMMLQQAHAVTAVFEGAVVVFMDCFQKSHFASQRFRSKCEKEYDQKVAERKQVDQELFNILINRIIAELDALSFLCIVKDLVPRILGIVDQFIKKTDVNEFLSNTPIKEGLFNQSLNISFEGLPISTAKSSRIYLYRMYTSLIKSNTDMILYLAKFDARFQELISEDYANQNNIFSLFCDLRGVFKCCFSDSGQAKRYIKLCDWFVGNHLNDSILIIQKNATIPEIVNIVCKLWISLFPDRLANPQKRVTNSSPNSNIDPTSGFGIILFRTSLAIVNAVLQSCDNNFAKFYILFKMIRFCMTTKYANFGVMNFYGDNSFFQMAGLFFQILAAVGFDNLRESPKLLSHILSTMSVITESEKCLVDLLFNCSENMNLVVKFTAKALQIEEQQNFWEKSWYVLRPILQRATMSAEMTQFVPLLFRPHTLIILHNVMSTNETKVMEMKQILLASYMFDADFLKEIVATVAMTYDENFRPYVQEQFAMLFGGFVAPITSKMLAELNDRLTRFRAAFRRYKTDFINSPSFVQLFQ